MRTRLLLVGSASVQCFIHRDKLWTIFLHHTIQSNCLRIHCLRMCRNLEMESNSPADLKNWLYRQQRAPAKAAGPQPSWHHATMNFHKLVFYQVKTRHSSARYAFGLWSRPDDSIGHLRGTGHGRDMGLSCWLLIPWCVVSGQSRWLLGPDFDWTAYIPRVLVLTSLKLSIVRQSWFVTHQVPGGF